MASIQTNKVISFIKGPLRKQLKRDFLTHPFRIFRESDLQSCVYFHLRKYLGSDHDWGILNEPHHRDLIAHGKHAQPDVVLVYKRMPKIVIELKFRHKRVGINTKDRRVLERIDRQSNGVVRVFYLETVITPKSRISNSRNRHKNELPPIFMVEEQEDQYRAHYDMFRKFRKR